MNRIIKFRAWDTKDKKMYSNAYLSPEMGEDIVASWFEEGPQHKSLQTGQILRKKKIINEGILMQFTGLTDKLGKEIYEEDIVSMADTYDPFYREGKITNTGIIKWDTTRFILKIDNTNTIDWIYDFGGSKDRYIFEVIGNIYENSKLLKI